MVTARMTALKQVGRYAPGSKRPLLGSIELFVVLVADDCNGPKTDRQLRNLDLQKRTGVTATAVENGHRR